MKKKQNRIEYGIWMKNERRRKKLLQKIDKQVTSDSRTHTHTHTHSNEILSWRSRCTPISICTYVSTLTPKLLTMISTKIECKLFYFKSNSVSCFSALSYIEFVAMPWWLISIINFECLTRLFAHFLIFQTICVIWCWIFCIRWQMDFCASAHREREKV